LNPSETKVISSRSPTVQQDLKNPVLAREREARFREESLLNIVSQDWRNT